MEQSPEMNSEETASEQSEATVANFDQTMAVPASEREEEVKDRLDTDSWREQP